jgi:hypothetical protein
MSEPLGAPARIWRAGRWLAAAGIVGALVGPQAASAATPVPTATGPVKTSKQSRIFTVGGTDLAGNGYRLDEHFVSGKANVYDWGADGKAATPRVRTAGAPYTTRIVVRRPAKKRRFSGNVWVELNNPSRAYDAEIQWPSAQAKFMRDGDIHIGLTVKPISIAALKRFDAKRYGRLSMANPLPAAQQACGKLPGEAGYDENTSKLYENGLEWDIISQVGALLHQRGKRNPLRGYRVRHVFATGESQTGFVLNTYVNNFAGAATLANGKPVYEGFVSVSGAGNPYPINQCVPATGVGDPRSTLPARHVPFMRVDSQTDVFVLNGVKWPHADSNARNAGYRFYEIAGAAHGWGDLANMDVSQADVIKSGTTPLLYVGCGGPNSRWNSLPRQYIEPSMYKNMERWVIRGKRPPKGRLLQLNADRTAFVKDQFGNALGGVRSPYVDVPIATYLESTTGPVFCKFLGEQIDFGSAQLQRMYVTRQKYVAKVAANTRRMRRAGFVEPADARTIVAEAAFQRIP